MASSDLPGKGWILSTDFDGTLLDSNTPPRVDSKLTSWISAFRERGGIWTINTGRELPYLTAGLRQSKMGIVPDYAIVVEREIYKFDHGDYEPVFPWFEQCCDHHAKIFEVHNHRWGDLKSWIATNASAVTYQDKYSPFSVIADDEEQASKIHRKMELAAQDMEKIIYVHNTIYGRFAHEDYHKGSALKELSRINSIPIDRVISAGDHWNDFSMFDNTISGYWIAPGNAISDLKEHILKHPRGYVAKNTSSLGILEALSFFFPELQSEKI